MLIVKADDDVVLLVLGSVNDPTVPVKACVGWNVVDRRRPRELAATVARSLDGADCAPPATGVTVTTTPNVPALE